MEEKTTTNREREEDLRRGGEDEEEVQRGGRLMMQKWTFQNAVQRSNSTFDTLFLLFLFFLDEKEFKMREINY